MSEYIIWESDKTEPIIEYREEFNVTDIARKYAERVARVIDEQTLANVENQLAEFGYVKVVRCRDCKFFNMPNWDNTLAMLYGEPPMTCDLLSHNEWRMDGDRRVAETTFLEVQPNGFCAWAVRRDG